MNIGKKRRVPGWAVLGAVSLALMMVPRAAAERARLTVAGGLAPVRAISERAAGGIERIGGEEDEAAQEMQARLDFVEGEFERLYAENRDLRAQLESLSRARSLVPRSVSLLSASVILPGDASGWGRTLVVDAGGEDGAAPGMAVMWGNQLVGRIAEVSAHSARVRLTTDPGFRVGVLTMPDRRDDPSAAQLLVAEGTGRGTMKLKWALDGEPTQVGWLVVTAGDPEAGLPRGAVVGRVARASERGHPYRDVEIDPGIRFDRLSQVAILVPRGAR